MKLTFAMNLWILEEDQWRKLKETPRRNPLDLTQLPSRFTYALFGYKNGRNALQVHGSLGLGDSEILLLNNKDIDSTVS